MNVKLLVILLVLLVLVAAGGIFIGLDIKSIVPGVTPTPTPPLLGGDRDAHGCIPSAGYGWCEVKQKCLRTWEEPCETPAPTPTLDETETLKVAIKQALVAEHGSTVDELTITVSKIQGHYAQGSVSSLGGGGMWFAAKVNGVWKLVWDGNGTVGCEATASYPDLPTAWVPECYNSTLERMIKR